MTVQIYENCVLTSRPRYDPELQLWVAYASIAWAEQKTSHYHKLENSFSFFESEAEALGFGFIAARAWIDDHLNVRQLA